MPSNSSQLGQIEHVVLLMLENRSFDHMLGFLYADQGNVSPLGQPFAGLTGNESNPDGSGRERNSSFRPPRGAQLRGRKPVASRSRQLRGQVSRHFPPR
jgi:hypothetical protein